MIQQELNLAYLGATFSTSSSRQQGIFQRVKAFHTFIMIKYAGHCRRSKDELVSDVFLWTPTYGQAKAGRPARTYIQQLCVDTGCNPEDLPEAMNDREKWREMVKDIRAGGTT